MMMIQMQTARWNVGFKGIANPRRSALPIRCQAQLGDKVLPMIRNTTDALLLGPRLALGALLSTNQNLERLPADLERLGTIISDPRPIEEKQTEVLLELEDRVANFIERGIGAENDVIATASEILPEEIKSALPEEVRKAVLTPRDIPSSAAAAEPWSTNGGTSTGGALQADPKPLASWTISSMDEEDSPTRMASSYSSGTTVMVDLEGEYPPISAATVAASQAAAELVEVQAAVMAVREQLTAMLNNADESSVNMLKLNLREAARNLDQRLQQRAPGAMGDAAAEAAVEEAQALLVEVELLLTQ